MSEPFVNVNFRAPQALKDKIERTAELLVKAGKISKTGGRSEFLRRVTEGACDDILKTPIAELGFPEVLDRFSTERKGELVAKLQHLMCMYDSLKMCKMIWFVGVKVDDMVSLLNLTTGWEMDQADFLQCGERIFNLKKLINLRLGATRDDDTVPYRIEREPRGSGSAADNLPPLEPMLDDYYRFRGWDSEGRPTQAKIGELGLEAYT